MGDDNSSSTDASNLPLAAPSAVTASSPYHLHPSGNPWSLITSFLLSSDKLLGMVNRTSKFFTG